MHSEHNATLPIDEGYSLLASEMDGLSFEVAYPSPKQHGLAFRS